MGVGASECAIQRRGKVDASRTACLPNVLLDPRAGAYDYVGI